MKAIGIDLGTTNSAAAYYDSAKGVVDVLTNSDGEVLTPSVVSLRRRDGQETTLVGRSALNWAAKLPKDTVLSVKRLMGRDFADPTIVRARSKFNYEIVSGPGEDPRAHVSMGGHVYTPSQISSMILEKLKRDASRTLGEEVTHAVITVPAYFHDAQRAATREAGEQAGLVVKKIIDEPTAAAVAFGLQAHQEARHRVLVYDLGGGTFDISILHTAKDREGRGQFQVLDFVGDNWLGGDDFDHAIVDKIIAWVRERSGVDPSEDKGFLLLAKGHAEQAKRQLGQMPEADIVIPLAFRAEGGPIVDVEMTVTRDEFDDMIEPFVARTMSLVHEALGRQNLSPADISDVLLVGGATLTPKVHETVESFFGAAKVRRNINPMECVARGAGILAGTLHGVECPNCKKVNDEAATACEECGHSLANASEVGDTGLYEVTGLSLGIAAVRGSQRDAFVPIIPKGTQYPLPAPMRRSFQATDGRLIRVPVYEGDHPVASRNLEQGAVEYELPQEIDVNSPVDVSFNYDRSRIVTVTISVPGTPLLKTTSLRADTPRTPPPVAADEEDGAGWRRELENVEAFARQFLEQYEPYIEPAQAMKLRRDLDQAQQALNTASDAECRRMTNVLQADVFSSGLATQLFLAERATDGATPAVTSEINRAVGSLQTSFQQGDRERVNDQAKQLKLLVNKALQERDVGELADAEDYGGLLRLLEES